MEQHSKLFDPIRISEKERAASMPKRCAHYGCFENAEYKAPISREREGEYYHFCYEHVKSYNQNYNYFSGMNYEELLNYQRETITGLRPTWKMGQNPAEFHKLDSRKIFEEHSAQKPAQKPEPKPTRFTPVVKRCFETLSLELSADAEQIHKQYKSLIKRLHPDANGGDRSTEDKFREVIEAYDVLKHAGFC